MWLHKCYINGITQCLPFGDWLFFAQCNAFEVLQVASVNHSLFIVEMYSMVGGIPQFPYPFTLEGCWVVSRFELLQIKLLWPWFTYRLWRFDVFFWRIGHSNPLKRAVSLCLLCLLELVGEPRLPDLNTPVLCWHSRWECHFALHRGHVQPHSHPLLHWKPPFSDHHSLLLTDVLPSDAHLFGWVFISSSHVPSSLVAYPTHRRGWLMEGCPGEVPVLALLLCYALVELSFFYHRLRFYNEK